MANEYEGFLQNLSKSVESISGMEGAEDMVRERRNKERIKIPVVDQNIGLADTPTTQEVQAVMPGGGDDYVTDSKNREAQGWWKGAKTSYTMASKNAELGQAWYDFKEGDRSPEKLAQINKLRGEITGLAKQAASDPYTAKAVGQLAPFIEMSMKEYGKGGMIGSLIGGGAAFIAGQMGPQAALPEEALTVPAAAAIGGKIGGMFSSLESMRKIEAGSAYGDLLEKGVHPDIAYTASEVYGGASIALEAGQLALLKRIIPGGNKLGKSIVDEAFEAITQKLGRSPLVKGGANIAGVATGEASVEATQQFMENLIGIVAEKSDKKLAASGATPETMKEYREALTNGVAETFAMTLVGMGITAIPGTSVNLVTDTIAGKKAMKKKIEETPDDKTISEAVAEEEQAVEPEPTPIPEDATAEDIDTSAEAQAFPPEPPKVPDVVTMEPAKTDTAIPPKKDIPELQSKDVQDAANKARGEMGFTIEDEGGEKLGVNYSDLTRVALRTTDGKILKHKNDLQGKAPSQFKDKDAENMYDAFNELKGWAEKEGYDIDQADTGFYVDGKFIPAYKVAELKVGESNLRERVEASRERLASKKVLREANAEAKNIAKYEKEAAKIEALRSKAKKGDEVAVEKILKSNKVKGKVSSIRRMNLGRDMDPEVLEAAGNEAVYKYMLKLDEDVVNDYTRATDKNKKADRVVETVTDPDGTTRNITVRAKVEGGALKAAEYAMRRAMMEEHGQRTGMTEKQVDTAVKAGTFQSPKQFEEGGKSELAGKRGGAASKADTKAVGIPKGEAPATNTKRHIQIQDLISKWHFARVDKDKAAEAKAKLQLQSLNAWDKDTERPEGFDEQAPSPVRSVTKEELEATRAAQQKATDVQRERAKAFVERTRLDERPEVTNEKAQLEAASSKPIQLKEEARDAENAKALGMSLDQYKVIKEAGAKTEAAQKKEAVKKGKSTSHAEEQRKKSGSLQLKKAKKFGLIPDGRDPNTGRFQFSDPKTKNTFTSESLTDEDIIAARDANVKTEEQTKTPTTKTVVVKKRKKAKGVPKPEVKPLKGETAKQAHDALTKQHKEQIAATDKNKFTQRVILGLQKVVKRAASGKVITMWRGQPDTDIGPGSDVGIHLSSSKFIPNNWFVGKRKSGDVNVLKKVRTKGKLNLLITNDAGAAWDNPEVLIDAAKFAKGMYGKENDAKLKKLVKAIQDATNDNKEQLDAAVKADDAKAIGDIMADTVELAMVYAGFDGIAYENLAERSGKQVMHNINYMIMNADKLEVVDTREEGKTAPKKKAAKKTPSKKEESKPKKVSKTKKKPTNTIEGGFSMNTPVQDQAKVAKKDNETEKLIEDLKKKLPKDSTNWGDMGSTPIFNDLANLIYDTSKKVADTFDVEAPWKRMGADKTGFAIKNLFSRREAEETRTLKLAKEFMDIVVADFGRKFTKNDLADIVRSAEKDMYRRTLEPEQKAKVSRAAEWLRDYFDSSKEKLLARGIDVNFKERMISELRQSIIETKDRQKQVKIMQRIREIKRMEFTHIPLAMWTMDKTRNLIKATGQKEFNKANAKLKNLTSQKRRALSINNLIEKGIIDAEKVNPIEVILSYGSRMGQDMALADIRDAAMKEKLIKVRKTKPRKQKLSGFTDGRGVTWALIPDRLTALKPYGKTAWIRADVLNAIDNAYGAIHKQTKYDKAVAILKMSAFYNPFFLPAYDLVQHAMTGAPVKFWKDFPAIKQAIVDVWTQNDNYFEAQAAGLSSKPFNMPFNKIKEEAVRLSTGKTAGYDNKAIGIAMSYVYKAMEQAPDLRHGSIFKTMYQASWDMAWFLDSVVRQMTYNFLKKEGISTHDAAQTAAKFHGDYASVPPATRKTLNRFLFTPTFKIAMGKLYYEMAKSPITWATNKVQGKKTSDQIRIYAIGAIGTVAVNLAFDMLMNSFGFEQDEWGRKYKKVVNTDEGDKELVLTWSSPSNMIQRYLFKAQAAAHPAQENYLKKLGESLSYEITPLIKNTWAIINNDTGGGEQIYSEFDSRPKQIAKTVLYGVVSSFQILKQFGGDAFTESYSTKEADEILDRDLNKFWNAMRNFFTFTYTRSTAERRKAAQIAAKGRRFAQEIRKEMRQNGTYDKEKIKNFERVIMRMAEEK